MILSSILQILAGGVLGIILSYIINNKKVEKDKYTLLFEKLMLESDNLRQQIRELSQDCERKTFMLQQEMLLAKEKHVIELADHNKKLAILENSVNNHHMQIIMLESSHSYSPYPIWLKDMNGIMLYVNEAYVETFLKPQKKTRSDILGKSVLNIWSDHVAKKLMQFDSEILRQDAAYNYYFEDYLRLKTLDDSIDMVYRIIKYKRYYEKTLIGIAGMAIPPMRGENYIEH
jgi:PAS domain-containing protein